MSVVSRIRRSQSGSPVQVQDPELGDFKRGGFRATAGPRLARPGNTRYALIQQKFSDMFVIKWMERRWKIIVCFRTWFTLLPTAEDLDQVCCVNQKLEDNYSQPSSKMTPSSFWFTEPIWSRCWKTKETCSDMWFQVQELKTLLLLFFASFQRPEDAFFQVEHRAGVWLARGHRTWSVQHPCPPLGHQRSDSTVGQPTRPREGTHTLLYSSLWLRPNNPPSSSSHSF